MKLRLNGTKHVVFPPSTEMYSLTFTTNTSELVDAVSISLSSARLCAPRLSAADDADAVRAAVCISRSAQSQRESCDWYLLVRLYIDRFNYHKKNSSTKAAAAAAAALPATTKATTAAAAAPLIRQQHNK